MTDSLPTGYTYARQAREMAIESNHPIGYACDNYRGKHEFICAGDTVAVTDTIWYPVYLMPPTLEALQAKNEELESELSRLRGLVDRSIPMEQVWHALTNDLPDVMLPKEDLEAKLNEIARRLNSTYL